MLALSYIHYAGNILYAFATLNYGQNYAGIIGSSLTSILVWPSRQFKCGADQKQIVFR